jgi:membrane-bound metal-dependent hydrolase YbcI (DUF457 family)
MYPTTGIHVLLSQMGIFIPTITVSLMISSFIIALSVLTVVKRNPFLRYINLIVYAVLVLASYQVYIVLWKFNMVWRWDTDSPSIPQAPFALLMVALQTLCLVILVLPSSSKFFKKER